MVAALDDYTGELSAFVEEELEKAIENFDFSSVVAEVAHEVIRESIYSYFRVGRGYEIIESAVQEALDKVFTHENPII